MKSAFTLIELLVVITIIVVLLALLAPALDQAIYQAELAQCAGKLKSVAGTVTVYAFENKRYYPDRGLGDMSPRSADGFISPGSLNKRGGYDVRPLHSKFMDINTMLQCPMVEPIELVDTEPITNASASYTMWWAWQYKTSGGNAATTGAGLDPITSHRGMFKVGDRFEWSEGGMTDSYRLLIGDYDLDQRQGRSHVTARRRE
jgi:prepilin-type N-terminal cleavage/methylation domain-containing protein